MNNAAEIIFVGLCSFLNVHNTASFEMPPPSVIVLQEHHTPFLAFDADEVEAVDGNGAAIGQQIGISAYRYVELKGEELTVINAPNGLPTVAASFDAIAKASAYAPESKMDEYDRDYIPRGNGRPSKKVVAAFLRFGGGTLARGRLTNVPYVFQLKDGREKTISGRFAEEGIYSFPGESIRIDASDLETRALTRKMVFTPKKTGNGTASGVRIWIGAAPVSAAGADAEIIGAIRGKQHGPYSDGDHLAMLNVMFTAAQGQTKKTKNRVPRPLREYDPMAVPRPAAKGLRAESSGYCGPDQKSEP